MKKDFIDRNEQNRNKRVEKKIMVILLLCHFILYKKINCNKNQNYNWNNVDCENDKIIDS